MGAGIPGTGMATLFYILSVFIMPFREIVPTVRGQSSWARWRLISRHLVIASAMTAAAYGTYRFVADALLPPDTTLGGVSALAVTALLFVLYLMLVNMLAFLVPGKVKLPQPKPFPERRRSARAEGPAPLRHPEREGKHREAGNAVGRRQSSRDHRSHPEFRLEQTRSDFAP